MSQFPFLKQLPIAAALAFIAGTAGAANYAYIPNSGSRTVSVIDTTLGVQTATLNPASLDSSFNGEIYSAALRPGSSNEAWFGQYFGSNKLGVIDTTDNSLKTSVTGTGSSTAITFSADGATAYISDILSGVIRVVDANTRQVTANLPAGCDVVSSVLSADGKTLYVRCANTNRILRLDTATNTLSSALTIASMNGYGLAYDPTGAGKLYSSNRASPRIDRVDLSNNSVTQITVAGISAVDAVAVRKDGTKLYASASNGLQLHIIDLTSPSVQTTLTLSGAGTRLAGLGISANDTALYAVANDGTVYVINLATETVSQTITAPAGTRADWIWGDFLGNVIASATPGGPSVASIAPQGSPLAGATSIQFAVTFSEAVGGVDASDFTLTSTGTAAGTLGTPASSDGGVTWVVPVNAISGTGSLRLDLNASATGIESAGANQPISGGFTTGAPHTVDVQVPVAGACGSAAEQTAAIAPAAGLCSVGTASAVASANGEYSWQCQGLNGGSANSCHAPWSTAGGGKAAVALQPANGWQVNSASFSATPPVAAPQGVSFPSGLLALNLGSGSVGSDATVTLNFTTPVPAGAVYMKYGPSPDGFNCQGAACAQPHWYELPAGRAVLAADRLSATLTLTDGGLGDHDGLANQFIQDPGGFAVQAAPVVSTAAIPTLSEWGVIALSSLLALFGLARMRRRQG
jgi:sugar lactone lactonase YvrE